MGVDQRPQCLRKYVEGLVAGKLHQQPVESEISIVTVI